MKLQIAGLCTLALTLAACGESPEQDTATTEQPATPAPEEPTLAENVSTAEGPYAPKDECGDLYGFDAFRGQLRRSVTFQSVDGLVTLSDPNVKLDFGGTSGPDALKAKLAENPSLWSEMGDAIALGCSATSDTSVSLPWIFSNLPDGADGFNTYLVTANDAPIFENADGTGETGTTVSWDLVSLAGDAPAEDAEFVEVTTMDDAASGYIKASNLRMVNGYRVLANRGDNGWKVTAILAGD